MVQFEHNGWDWKEKKCFQSLPSQIAFSLRQNQESTACEQPLKEDKEDTQETSVTPTTSANDISSV